MNPYHILFCLFVCRDIQTEWLFTTRARLVRLRDLLVLTRGKSFQVASRLKYFHITTLYFYSCSSIIVELFIEFIIYRLRYKPWHKVQ